MVTTMDDDVYQKILDALDHMGLHFLRFDATHRDVVVYKSKGGFDEYIAHINIIIVSNRHDYYRYKN
jgi:hypothetical protein